VALSPGNNVINGVYIGGAIGNVLPAKFMAMGYGFRLYDAIGTVSGGLAVANNYVNVRPADPTALSATAFSSTEIDLAWTDNATNEYGFRIERKTETGQWGFVADRPANSVAFRDSGLTKKTKYYYRVFAYADEDSSPSNTANATTLNEKPAVPVGLSAIAQNDSEIRLTWVDSSDNEDSFIVERRQDSIGTWGEVKTTLSNVVLWTDTGLTKKTAYSYRVKAHNEMGDSVWSNISGDTTKDTKPNKPLNLVATANSYSQITLTWTDDSDNEDGFRIERQTPTGWISVGTTSANQALYPCTNLEWLTSYTFRVLAVNSGGDSEASNLASASTLAPPAPTTVPVLVAIPLSQNSVQLNWTDLEPVVGGFELQRREPEDDGSAWITIATLPASSRTSLDTTAEADVVYDYQIRAINPSGASAWSAPATATTPAISDKEFIVLTMYSENVNYSLAEKSYKNTIVAKLQSYYGANYASKVQTYSFNYPSGIMGSPTVVKATVTHLREYLKKAKYFYIYTHGFSGPSSYSPFKHGVSLGNAHIKTHGGNTATDIDVSAIGISPNQYRFVWMDACSTAGAAFGGPNDLMRSTPSDGWGSAFGISDWSTRGLVANNGYAQIIVSTSYSWYQWKVNLWHALLVTKLPLSDAISAANQGTDPGTPTPPYYPWATEFMGGHFVSKIFRTGEFQFP
jgi:Fibronectin type III domain